MTRHSTSIAHDLRSPAIRRSTPSLRAPMKPRAKFWLMNARGNHAVAVGAKTRPCDGDGCEGSDRLLLWLA